MFAEHPGEVAALIVEPLVQGAAGIRVYPPEVLQGAAEVARRHGALLIADEVATGFGRTGELFAYRSFELDEYVDVVTVGKALQGSAALFTRAYNPKPGLVAGTYAGATVGMAVGARFIERLESEGYLGAEGRVRVLAGRVLRRIEALRRRMPNAVGASSGIGAMHAFVPFDGSREVVADVLPWTERHPVLLWLGLLVVVTVLGADTWRALRSA